MMMHKNMSKMMAAILVLAVTATARNHRLLNELSRYSDAHVWHADGRTFAASSSSSEALALRVTGGGVNLTLSLDAASIYHAAYKEVVVDAGGAFKVTRTAAPPQRCHFRGGAAGVVDGRAAKGAVTAYHSAASPRHSI